VSFKVIWFATAKYYDRYFSKLPSRRHKTFLNNAFGSRLHARLCQRRHNFSTPIANEAELKALILYAHIWQAGTTQWQNQETFGRQKKCRAAKATLPYFDK
jgi:hypothetical protein